MEAKPEIILRTVFLLIVASSVGVGQATEQERKSFEEYIIDHRQGRWITIDLIVQQLLRAKRDLELDKLLKKLSRFDALMIDDFGYVKQDRDEMEVLFTLLAHRYEQGSMLPEYRPADVFGEDKGMKNQSDEVKSTCRQENTER